MLTIRQTIRYLSVLAVTVSASVLTTGYANADDDSPLMFTIEAPGIQTSQVAETDEITLHTQNFNNVPKKKKVFRDAYPQHDSFEWGDIGTYQGSGAKVDKNNQYGGAEGKKRYLFIENTSNSADLNPGVTLTFDEPVAYFGFWWSAGDADNQLTITLADDTIVIVGTDVVLNSDGFVNDLSSNNGHLGNPTNKYKDQNGSEGYAYLNLFAKTNGQKIKKIRFHGTNFETDNHTVAIEIISTKPGSCIDGCEPEPECSVDSSGSSSSIPDDDDPLRFTIEAPGIDMPQITETEELALHVQNFDQVPESDEIFRDAYPENDSFNWEGIGTYQGSGAQIDAHNKYGGAGGRESYLFVKEVECTADLNPGVTLTFDEPVTYFGFWWSAGDHQNKLQVTLTDGTVVNVNTQLVLNSDGFINELSSDGGHLGSPTNTYKDQNGDEGYAYLNLFAKTDDQKIEKIRFHGTNFETDNHAITTEIVPNPPGVCITGCSPIPLDYGQDGRFSFREVNTHIVNEEAGSGGGVD